MTLGPGSLASGPGSRASGPGSLTSGVGPSDDPAPSSGEFRIAAILAGGESQRMQRDKRMLAVDGGTLLERQVEHVAPLFDRVLIALENGKPTSEVSRVVERVVSRFPGKVATVHDKTAGLGPLEAVRSVLEEVSVPWVFFLAVDLPTIHAPLIEWLSEVAQRKGVLGCVPQWGARLEVAYAVYHRELQASIEPLLSGGAGLSRGAGRSKRAGSLRELASVGSVQRLVLDSETASRRLFGRSLPPPALQAELGRIFANLNTPADYERWCRGESGPDRDRK